MTIFFSYSTVQLFIRINILEFINTYSRNNGYFISWKDITEIQSIKYTYDSKGSSLTILKNRWKKVE